MNPAALLESVAGGGASSGVADQSATSSSAATGDKNIGVSANPYAAGRAVERVLSSPLLLLAVGLFALYLFKRGK